ncbi:hypothetical protein HPB48_020865 [Haemaphysalis longicornis]|uniref:Uncharacterized protein n=1 Tax=Haemaphysalis longicornis TaxID=44386 RepID=A0A9J6GJ54_HAELO|nr:hypothetical protein HPB48_020865 [Haemaphysalis longicornis]
MAVSHITTARPTEADDDDTWAIITDSQADCRAYSSENPLHPSKQHSSTLRSIQASLNSYRLDPWPGPLPVNEHVRVLAREMTHRASGEADRQIQGDSKTSASITPSHERLNYTLTLAYYRTQRKTPPPPTTPYPAPTPGHGGSSRHTCSQTYTTNTFLPHSIH